MNHGEIKRQKKTIDFLRKHCPPPSTVLDLGTPNMLSKKMADHGFKVYNTEGQDLDKENNFIKDFAVDAVTAFEILEHLVSPFNVLREIRAEKLIATVPLRLWFAKAYRNPKDPWDRHFHEFEDWQFDWLLEKAGWTIKAREKWTNPTYEIGFRPILRFFTPRYYAVYAERT